MPEVELLTDPALRADLERAGLFELDTLFTREDLHVVKARLAERQTLRYDSPSGGSFYVKRYQRPCPDGFFAGLFAQAFSSPAAREWHVLGRLQELGVPAPRPAACLEELQGGRVTRAAVITVGLDAGANLEQVLVEQPMPAARRHELARELARLLKTMHEGGVNHRDFYLVHILVGPDDKLYVTDLNRADLRRRVPRRWRVKDVAALLHSAPPQVTATDKARFAKAYLGGRLRDHRGFLKAVIRKAARMTAHTRRRVEQGRANYHLARNKSPVPKDEGDGG
jgi:heptose I phosphotransferase